MKMLVVKTNILSIFLTLITFVNLNCQNQSSNWQLPFSDYPNNYILCSAIDNNGNIWLGSEFSCVTKIENGVWTSYDLFCAEIISLDVDKNNNLWIGSDGCELTKFDGTNFTTYSPIQDSSINARTVSIDNNYNIWFGTMLDGIYKLSDTTWVHYDTSNSSLPSNFITSITNDSKNNLWGRSWKYLVYFNGDTWQPFSKYYPCPWDQAIAVDSEDIVWFGTWEGELISFDQSSWNIIQPPEGVDYLGAIAIDSNNNKWCGFDGGFAKYDGQSWELFTTDNSPLPNEWVTSIVIDTLGNKWLGTYGGGVAIYNENGVVTSVNQNSTDIPLKYNLSQNYPNPFNPTTTIQYSVPSNGVMLNSFQHLNDSEIPKQVRDDNTYVTLKVYDVVGREVATIVNQQQKPGKYSVQFDASNLSSGIYYYRLSAGKFSDTKKLILLK